MHGTKDGYRGLKMSRTDFWKAKDPKENINCMVLVKTQEHDAWRTVGVEGRVRRQRCASLSRSMRTTSTAIAGLAAMPGESIEAEFDAASVSLLSINFVRRNVLM